MSIYEYGEAELVFDKPDNLVETLEISVKKFPNNKLFGTKISKNEYKWTTYAEFGQYVDRIRSGLAKIGINKGDTVGVISNNSVEWATASFATYGLGGRFVSMYENEIIDTWKFILNNSSTKVLFVPTKEILDKIEKIRIEIPLLERIVLIERLDNLDDHVITFDNLKDLGDKNHVKSIYPSYQDIAGLIYTSGTTGNPKGVLLTHGNFTSNFQAGSKIYPSLDESSRALSILPWNHSYAQTAELYNFIYLGASIAINTNIDELADDLKLANPTHLMCVPRLFNKIYDGIHAKMIEKGGLTKKLFDSALNRAKMKREKGRAGIFGIRYNILSKLVFKKIRSNFGNQLQFALTASAKTSNEVGNFFYDVGIPIYDCYGTTETSPAVTMNGPQGNKLGSVGKPLEKIKVVIDKSVVEEGAKDGEIIVYGPNVMVGYHSRQDLTNEVLTKDGGYRTGDRGRLDEDGYLYLTGRIKQEYKLQNGKYVHPEEIEEYIKSLPWVANAFVYGDGKEYNVCLVVPDYVVLENFAKKLKMLVPTKKILEENESIRDLISKEIRGHLKGSYNYYEIPKKYLFLTEDFTLENGLLTQTLKIKREYVHKKYEKELESLYNQ